MKDPVSISRLALLHPKVKESFQHFIEDAEQATGRTFRIVQGLRTFAEQEAIYEQGRTKPGRIVTYSPAGASYHNYGLAVDIAPIIYDANNKPKDLDWSFNFAKLEPIGAKYGITWGGRFPSPDKDHFEKKCGGNWRDYLHKYQAKDFMPGTQYVNIQ